MTADRLCIALTGSSVGLVDCSRGARRRLTICRIGHFCIQMTMDVRTRSAERDSTGGTPFVSKNAFRPPERCLSLSVVSATYRLPPDLAGPPLLIDAVPMSLRTCVTCRGGVIGSGNVA